MNELEKIVNPLLKWYQENKRNLPWREENNAYHIWLSEIMLQQTRIEAVKVYYTRFIQELPTINDLAMIEEEKLLKLWEGLGYYTRARNLKKAAMMIQEKYEGIMPNHYRELLELPGIGEYTAGAIASIAFKEKVPAIDGNVLRVISRIIASKEDILLLSTKKNIEKEIKVIIPEEAGDFNEALMELGETICVPNGNPLCEKCPLQNYCKTKQENLINEIPVRIKKVERKIEKRTVFLFVCQGKIAIRKREEKLLHGMYEFPNIEEHIEKEEIQKYLMKWNLKEKEICICGTAKHVFTHKEWNMIGYEIEVFECCNEFLWIELDDLVKYYAIPTAFSYYKKYLLNQETTRKK